MALKLSNAAANAGADALLALLNSGGKIRIYNGTRPATADTAISGQTLLAELTFSSTAFAAASAGVATANSISPDTSADATGTATWFRCLTSGNAAVFDGDVGTSGSDLNMPTTSIVAAAEIQISSATFTMPKG